jgi:hypothetical protein
MRSVCEDFVKGVGWYGWQPRPNKFSVYADHIEF